VHRHCKGLSTIDYRLSTRKIGLMGGTFDPVHYGHLMLAEQAWETLKLDKVLFVTAADPPHKNGIEITPVRHRHQMACLAVLNNDHFECSALEIERPGPSYTIDTLRQIKGIYGPDCCVYLLVGADEAAAMMTWRDPYAIAELATIVVANRPGHSVRDVLKTLPEDFARNVVPLEMPGVDISSTDMRERARSGRTIRYLAPDAVVGYISEEKIYGG